MSQSYRLDNIGSIEVGEKKIEYEGTLNDLYDNVVSKDQPKIEIGINWILVDINDAY